MHTRRFRVSIALAAFASACSTSLAPVGEARLAWSEPIVVDLADGPTPIVRVAIDGQRELPFLVDTGSSLSLLDPAAAERLGLRVRRYKAAFSTKGSDGREVPIERCANVRQLELGALQLEQTYVALLDSDVMRALHVDGILGQDLLGRLAIIVDLERRKLHVLPPASDAAAVEEYLRSAKLGEGRWGLLPLEMRPCPYFPLVVGGLSDVKVGMEIDTGATNTSIPQRVVDALGIAPTGTVAVRSVNGIGEVGQYRLNRFNLSGVELSGTVQATALDYGLLGMDLLGGLVFVVDGPNQRALLHRRTPESAEAR